jgi:two-component system, OmpR family, sensor histidine kinase KdpD
MNRWTRVLVGALFGVGCVAVVTGIVFGLREVAPVLSLGVLYIFAVLPVAVLFGLTYAAAVSVLSMLAFNFFFLPPTHTLSLRDSENWVALAVYLLTAILVSELAARARRRAADAEEREREAGVLARASASLLQTEDVADAIREIAEDTARALGAESGRIELDSLRRAGPGESAHELQAGNRRVGRLFLPAGAPIDPDAEARLLPALASLLAVATDRERLRGKALEAEAFRRSDAAKTAVLRSVSHDLRSPLTAIRAAAEGLQSGALELTDADREELLETIRIETKRLDRLVANLLDLSLLESGGARPEAALWTLDDLVGRSLEMAGRETDRVVVSLPPHPVVVQVDAAQIERAFANVLENAIRFSPPDEPIRLDAELQEREVIVRVSDSGPGIPAGDLERVFEPFSRGRIGGSGLGLAIVRGFTEANGGRVWVEPRTEGGTTIAIALPAARVPAPAR